MSQPLAVVFAADDTYALPLAVGLGSTLSYTPPEADVVTFLLDGGISPDNRARISNVVDKTRPRAEVRWIGAEDLQRFESVSRRGTGSKAAYLRLIIPRIIPDEFDLALYLDSDILVRRDLRPMVPERDSWADAVVCAVSDFHHKTIGSAFGNNQARALGLDPANPYFNSGVMVVNLENWRESSIYRRALEFAKRNRAVIRNDDQDALNAVIGSRWKPIDPSWNVMIQSAGRFAHRVSPDDPDSYRRHLLDHAGILHFAGRRKPWNPGYDRFGASEYMAALARSGWFQSTDEFRRWLRRYRALSPYWRLRYSYRHLKVRTARRVRNLT